MGFVGILVAHIWFLIKRRANPIFSGLAWAFRKPNNKGHCLVLSRPLWLLKELFCVVGGIKSPWPTFSLLFAQVTFFRLHNSHAHLCHCSIFSLSFQFPLLCTSLWRSSDKIHYGFEAWIGGFSIAYSFNLEAWSISWALPLLYCDLRETSRKKKAIGEAMPAFLLSSTNFCVWCVKSCVFCFFKICYIDTEPLGLWNLGLVQATKDHTIITLMVQSYGHTSGKWLQCEDGPRTLLVQVRLSRGSEGGGKGTELDWTAQHVCDANNSVTWEFPVAAQHIANPEPTTSTLLLFSIQLQCLVPLDNFPPPVVNKLLSGCSIASLSYEETLMCC